MPPVAHSGTDGQVVVSGSHEVTIPEFVSGGWDVTEDIFEGREERAAAGEATQRERRGGVELACQRQPAGFSTPFCRAAQPQPRLGIHVLVQSRAEFPQLRILQVL